MWLTCPDCSSEFEFGDALILVRQRELECPDCEHAWCQAPALRRVQGPGARP